MAQFNEAVEAHLISRLLDEEYLTAKMNSKDDYDDFEAAIDLFDNERTERDYDWMSDIPLPEFSAQMLTQTSIDVSQYFQTRDFVETYIQDPSDQALLAADAAEECLNRTLNRRDLYHYQKFVRAKTMNNIGGLAYAHCWWEKNGGKGKFNYEILDPRNVVCSREYSYSLQDKEFVTLRYQRSLQELKSEQKRHKYFNLDKLETMSMDNETETKRETRDHDEGSKPDPLRKYTGPFDIYKRYGKYWMMPDGSPGIDEDGEIREGANWEEAVVIFAQAASSKVLIGFHRQPYKASTGEKYRPIIRGICYIHPTKDVGFGDGHFARPLQKAINDTFNLSNDRVLLATMPTMQGKKYVTEDNDDIFFEPQHVMAVNEIGDVQEFKIEDNIQGALQQLGILTGKLQQVTSVYPPTMGATEQSETATAIATGERHTNQRTNYKSLTFEYTFLNELYWMILNMTFAYATLDEARELLGDKMYDFNPTLDFFYKPLSQSLETDSSRNAKIQLWTQVLGYVAGMAHPDAPLIFNYILSKIVVLMGDEFENVVDKLLNPEKPMEPMETPEENGMVAGPSNQFGVPMQTPEQQTRQEAELIG